MGVLPGAVGVSERVLKFAQITVWSSVCVSLALLYSESWSLKILFLFGLLFILFLLGFLFSSIYLISCTFVTFIVYLWSGPRNFF